jgi:hypothetical protein
VGGGERPQDTSERERGRTVAGGFGHRVYPALNDGVRPLDAEDELI